MDGYGGLLYSNIGKTEATRNISELSDLKVVILDTSNQHGLTVTYDVYNPREVFWDNVFYNLAKNSIVSSSGLKSALVL